LGWVEKYYNRILLYNFVIICNIKYFIKIYIYITTMSKHKDNHKEHELYLIQFDNIANVNEIKKIKNVK